MKVLLTGADGFLGSHILRELLERGHMVRAFLQESRNHSSIAGLDYEPFFGDLLNEADIDSALTGCDAVIHTVAITDIWPARNQFMWKINLDAVKTLSRLVIQHDITKFIYIGTANSFGFGSKESPGNEKTPYKGNLYGLDYMDSKKAAQDYLLEQFAESNLPVVIINPSFMIGEYDTKPGSGAMVLSVIKRKMPAYAEGGRCFSYAGDTAVAVANALNRGTPGECYITGGTNLTYREFFDKIAVAADVKPPKYKLPYPFLISMARLLEIIAVLGKRCPMFSMAMVRISRDGHYYSSEKAIRNLGMPRTPMDTAIKRTIGWFKENGYC